jgi:hypothetical protein
MSTKNTTLSEYYDNAAEFLRSRARWFKQHADMSRRQAQHQLSAGEISHYTVKIVAKKAMEYEAHAKYWADFADRYEPKF